MPGRRPNAWQGAEFDCGDRTGQERRKAQPVIEAAKFFKKILNRHGSCDELLVVMGIKIDFRNFT